MALKDLFKEDSILPEAVAIVLLLAAMLVMLTLSQYVLVPQGPGVSGDDDGLGQIAVKNKYVLYAEGFVIILGFCIAIYGAYTIKKDWETIDDRNKAMHKVIWGLTMIVVTMIFNIGYTLFL